jgi:hypothetical protein
MPRGKQYVFSARTTEEGLRVLNAKKAELGVNWDDLIIYAVNAHYGLDILKLPKVERPKKESKPKAETRKPNKRPKAEREESRGGRCRIRTKGSGLGRIRTYDQSVMSPTSLNR